MPPKRKSDDAASSVRKQPRLDDCAVIEVDPDGDLELAVETPNASEPAKFLVNRHVLCLSSPVFKAMIGKHSRFMEAQSSALTGKVLVEDESIKAMGIMLHVIHLQGHLVPETVSFVLLRHLAVLCDKYDLRKSLGTWPETWGAGHTQKLEKPCNDSLFIACAFKFDEVYPKVTKAVIEDTRSGQRGSLVTSDGVQLGDCISEYILVQIVRARSAAILNLEAQLWNLLSSLQDPGKACKMAESEREDSFYGSRTCQYSQLGVFRRYLPDLEHPHEQSPFRSRSLNSIFSDCLEIANDGNARWTFTDSHILQHRNCGFRAQIDHLMHQPINDIKGLQFKSSWNIHHGK